MVTPPTGPQHPPSLGGDLPQFPAPSPGIEESQTLVNLPVNHRQRGNEGLPAACWLAVTFTRVTTVVAALWWPQATEQDGTMGGKSRSWAGTSL